MPVTECDNRSLSGLGMNDLDVALVCRAVCRGRGVVFVCGPPGSGRRTAMYSLLCSVNDEHVSVTAVHHAVQERMVRVTQAQPERAEDIAEWLGHAHRMDADVVMVEPLARIADAVSLVRAARRTLVVVGSLAASSLEPLLQLLDLGAPPDLVCGTVSCVMSSRVVPRLCSRCRAQTEMPYDLLAAFPLLMDTATQLRGYTGSGCEHCAGTGRRGVIALYEVREVGPHLASTLKADYPRSALEDAGLRATIMALTGDALRKSDAGLVDLRDLAPLLATCPSKGPVVRFWEN
jgi:type II secretory ATPase GspE/PulE/Tfp pilus assembly ATPase PilB-like protein